MIKINTTVKVKIKIISILGYTLPKNIKIFVFRNMDI